MLNPSERLVDPESSPKPDRKAAENGNWFVLQTQLAPVEDLARVTVTLPKSLTRRVNVYRDAFRMSVSSIVEHAVRAYLERANADELLDDLRARGASRRRSRR